MKKEYDFNIPKKVQKVLDSLEERGFPAYIVGGKLRDLLLNRKSNDFDVTTSATPEEIREIFKDKPQILSGMKHGTVSVICDREPVEITTFRKDGKYSDSRHPDKVEFASDISQDLARRDFTVNAMAYRCKDGKIVDIYGGKEDIEKKIIRSVGDPEKRFSEDALRIMRAFRFCSTLDFDIEENTLKYAKKLSYKLENIAKERIGIEFVKLLEGQNPAKSLSLMGDVLKIVLLIDNIDEKRLERINEIRPVAEVRLAYILQGESREAVQKSVQNLKLSNKSKSLILLLSEENSLFNENIGKLKENQKNSEIMRRLLAKYGEFAKDFVQINCMCKGIDGSDLICAELDRIKSENPCLSIGDLSVNGNDLIENNIAKGAKIGRILALLLEKVLKNPDLNEKQILLNLAKEISENK